MAFLDRPSANLRYAFALASFLHHKIDAEEARRLIRERAEGRNQNFLRLIESAVYQNPSSPYLRLLRHAGIELSKLRSMVEEAGLERTLEQLYDAGVFVTLDEFKGRRPIRRDGLEFPVTQADFDNPLLGTHFGGASSGSRGPPARAKIDFGHMATEAPYMALVFPGQEDSPMASLGIGLDSIALRDAKVGKDLDKSFSILPARQGFASWALRKWSWAANYLLGFHLPQAEYVPRADLVKIAEWLAAQKARGTPAIIVAFATPAVRVCLAAREHGLDIGTHYS